MILSKESIKANWEYDKRTVDRLKGHIVSQFAEQRVKIYEDLLENYGNEEQAEEYCRKQISLFKACYGMTVPASQAGFIIDLYHEILQEDKEFNK